MKKVSNIIWGVLLILIGIIWALNATGLASVDVFFKGWWTLFIIVPSIIGIIEKPSESSGYIVFLIGVVLLLWARGIISFVLISKLLIPIILIIVGVGIIFKDTVNKNFIKNTSSIDKDGTEIYSATFSENKVKLSGNEFHNAKIDSTFGSVKLDLSDCNIESDGMIVVSSIFSGVEIKVPQDVNVRVKSTGIFGGTSKKIKNKDTEGRKTIYVESFALFGGVEIK